MPPRFMITLTSPDDPVSTELCALEGLSDQTPGTWANWEPTAPSQAIFGVQREIADLATTAASLPDLFPQLASSGTHRPEEHLLEWFIGEESLTVDFTFVIALMGRDVLLSGASGRIALVGT